MWNEPSPEGEASAKEATQMAAFLEALVAQKAELQLQNATLEETVRRAERQPRAPKAGARIMHMHACMRARAAISPLCAADESRASAASAARLLGLGCLTLAPSAA